jgi:hypothetical protein
LHKENGAMPRCIVKYIRGGITIFKTPGGLQEVIPVLSGVLRIAGCGVAVLNLIC